MSKKNTFVGFGFGAIQSGLFLAEAFASGRFTRLVVAEVNPARVAAIRTSGGRFTVNVAEADRRVKLHIEGVEIYNPALPEDAAQLGTALSEASEIATALPSVECYERGNPSVAALLAAALERKQQDPSLPPAIVYTAENHNHAAEHLARALGIEHDDKSARMQMLNTVIGKMSSVVSEPDVIRALGLEPVVPGAEEAFLVESFNRILISCIQLPDFERSINVFEEKDDLLPFEEAKLYGHNAIHALLGYLARERGVSVMSDLSQHADLVDLGRRAFVDESGVALCRKYAGFDELFTAAGFKSYAEDLLERMQNPWLRDPVDRITRDPLRKLGWNDRLIGAIRLVLAQSVEPHCLARGARAALALMADTDPEAGLRAAWGRDGATAEEMNAIMTLISSE